MSLVFFLLSAVVLASATSIVLQSNSKIGSYTLQAKQSSLKRLEKSLQKQGFIPANIIVREITATALDMLPLKFFTTLTRSQMRDLMESYVMAKQSNKGGEESLMPFQRALFMALKTQTIRSEVTGEELIRLGFHPRAIPIESLNRKQLQAFIDNWSIEMTLTHRVQTELDQLVVNDLIRNQDFGKCKIPNIFFRKLAYVQPPVGWPKQLQNRARREDLIIEDLQIHSGVKLDENQNTLQNLKVYESNKIHTKDARIKRDKERKERKKGEMKKKKVSLSDADESSSSEISDEETPSTSEVTSSEESKKKKKSNGRRKKNHKYTKSFESDLSSSSSSSEQDRKPKGRRRRHGRPNAPGERTVLKNIKGITISATDE